jgi:autoinducer 2 (AI-2) kinase
MPKKEAYIVIDIGTGNVRVVVVKPNGEVLGEARDDIQYKRDELYPESIFFEPAQLWDQIVKLGHDALAQSGQVSIRAFTGTSQREGIVLIAASGESLMGLPNIDHRGREWESTVRDKNRMYQVTGRFPTSLFSALKLVGTRERRKDIWDKTSVFLSISDWVEYKLSGIAKYEHSQASETLLYDVEKKQWSDELAEVFGIEKSMLLPLHSAASKLGKVLPDRMAEFGITGDAVVVTGGGDTQLAIKSTQPAVDDFVIVSGTTTPVVKLVDRYITDTQQRTWTSRDITAGNFVFEANAGVTGLNYQRLKEVFYPNEGYDVIEKELAQNPYCRCSASLGSLVATEKTAITRGGFIFPVPVSHELSRSCFVWATLLDIGFSIAENYKVLRDVAGHTPGYVWACGGGLQSKILRQIIANIIGKNVQVRYGFRQSSAVGGALVCNEALGINDTLLHTEIETEQPQESKRFEALYEEWRQTRNFFRKSSE